MTRLFLLLLMLIPCAADAIVIRDDVSDSKYRIADSEFPALVDLPGEGHGVLIAPRWVVTAAHAISWQTEVNEVTVNGISRSVKRLIVYPGYEKLPQPLVAQALATGDWTAALKFLADSNDIALIELSLPVADVKPAARYNGNPELGEIVEIMGKGGTGTGLSGQAPQASHRTVLRRAYSRLTQVQDRWLGYMFEKPPSALPLEGATGDGDSGGPLLIEVKGQWQVAGLASWKVAQSKAGVLRTGLYGQPTYAIRLSHYVEWIDGVISSN